MNILELCVVPALGGLELYFHRCCIELGKTGHSVISVRLAGSRLEELARKDGIQTYSLRRGNRFFPFGNARRLAGLIAQHRIDLVHAHHKDDLPLVALAQAICARPFKLVFTRQMPLKHQKKDPYHRWLYARIDLMITITELLRNDALQKLPIPAERIRRLYYGVASPPPLDADYIKEFLRISAPGDFNLGVFSRLEFQKGQHLVIEATRKLRQRNIPAKLYIAGDVMNAEYKDSLVQQVESAGLQNDVHFTGFLSQPVKAMRAMDVLILPSRNEAFGLVLIEAMRCGVAVMGVRAGGVPEIIDHDQTGLLFEWDNTDQLADQLEQLFRDPDYRLRLAARGKRKADQEFNSELHFKRLEALFVELAEGKS